MQLLDIIKPAPTHGSCIVVSGLYVQCFVRSISSCFVPSELNHRIEYSDQLNRDLKAAVYRERIPRTGVRLLFVLPVYLLRCTALMFAQYRVSERGGGNGSTTVGDA